MNKLSLLLILLLTLVSSCGGSSSGGGATVTLTPNTSEQFLNVDVKATFSSAVTAPGDWATYFKVTKQGETSNLCTGYTSTSTTDVSCMHPDFDNNTTYTITFSGLAGTTDPAAVNFTTVNVTASKSTVTSTDPSNPVTLTFLFSTAPSETPELVIEALSANIAAGRSVEPTKAPSADACTLSGATATCTVTGIAGCRTYEDYLATLYIGSGAVSAIRFNSADDEFNWSNSIINTMIKTDLTGCWTKQNSSNDTEEIASEKLSVTLQEGAARMNLSKPDSSSLDLAWSSYFGVATELLAGMNLTGLQFQNSGGGSTLDFIYGQAVSDPSLSSIALLNDMTNLALKKDGGPFQDVNLTTTPIYFCMVSKSGIVTTYLSTSGTGWTQTGDENMACTAYGAITGCSDITDITEFNAAAFITLAPRFVVENSMDGTTAFAETIDYARFNTTDIVGDSTDCPRF